MENTEDLEKIILDKVKEKHLQTGGGNGLSLYKLLAELGIDREVMMEIIERMIKEKKITYMYPLNGTTLSLPK